MGKASIIKVQQNEISKTKKKTEIYIMPSTFVHYIYFISERQSGRAGQK